MTRIAILDDYQRVARESADWASLDANGGPHEVTVFEQHLGTDEAALAKALAPFEVIVAMRERTPFPASLLARLPALQLLVTTGLRNLAIDMDAARAQGITVCGTQMTGFAAFEHTWALILGAAKNIAAEDRSMRDGGWQAAPGFGLRGRTLGVLGLGKLGSQVAKIGVAFGMNVIAWSENLTDERATECGATRVTLDALLAESDVATIHLVLSDRTRDLIGARELALMKRTAWLVNTSRGPIVNEGALLAALQARSIGGAAIDVYDVEPLPADHPLRSCDNTLLTGHTGYVIEEAFGLSYGQAVEDIAAWMANDPVRVLN